MPLASDLELFFHAYYQFLPLIFGALAGGAAALSRSSLMQAANALTSGFLLPTAILLAFTPFNPRLVSFVSPMEFGLLGSLAALILARDVVAGFDRRNAANSLTAASSGIKNGGTLILDVLVYMGWVRHYIDEKALPESQRIRISKLKENRFSWVLVLCSVLLTIAVFFGLLYITLSGAAKH